jgi:hypothetical protein
MTLTSRDLLETWMSAFMDGELDYESSTALLEALHGDIDLRHQMMQFLSNHQKIQTAMQSAAPVLSSQEQSDLIVHFWESIEQEAQAVHQEDFLQERAYLLAQNVLQGRLDKDALEKLSLKDPTCVQEAAKLIGQMESVRDVLTASAQQEPLDELRKETMNQIFGVPETGLFLPDQDADSILDEQIESIEDDSQFNAPLAFIPPLPDQAAAVANDNALGEPMDEDDEDLGFETPGAKVVHLFKKAKWPALATAAAAAIGLFILPATKTPDSQETLMAASDLILSESGDEKADPYFEDRMLAAWQMELAGQSNDSLEALPILKDNSNTEIKSLDVGSTNPMVFSTPNKKITVIWIGEQQG